ncbi:hypothetical protein HOY80DRAFT_703058 [Tuber brumale]|nr:hypothetical protein HOY80DRAFT_703058 [Tuber brumale]
MVRAHGEKTERALQEKAMAGKGTGEMLEETIGMRGERRGKRTRGTNTEKGVGGDERGGAVAVLHSQCNHIFISGAWAAGGWGVYMELLNFRKLFTQLRKALSAATIGGIIRTGQVIIGEKVPPLPNPLTSSNTRPAVVRTRDVYRYVGGTSTPGECAGKFCRR